MTFDEQIQELSAEGGEFLATFGVAVTGSLFTTGSGTAIIGGPTFAEIRDDSGRVRTRRAITVQVSRAACVATVLDSTVVFGGVTYLVTGPDATQAPDSHWYQLNAVETGIVETGRRSTL